MVGICRSPAVARAGLWKRREWKTNATHRSALHLCYVYYICMCFFELSEKTSGKNEKKLLISEPKKDSSAVGWLVGWFLVGRRWKRIQAATTEFDKPSGKLAMI